MHTTKQAGFSFIIVKLKKGLGAFLLINWASLLSFLKSNEQNHLIHSLYCAHTAQTYIESTNKPANMCVTNLFVSFPPTAALSCSFLLSFHLFFSYICMDIQYTHCTFLENSYMFVRARCTQMHFRFSSSWLVVRLLLLLLFSHHQQHITLSTMTLCGTLTLITLILTPAS
jgi:hypothetical protein